METHDLALQLGVDESVVEAILKHAAAQAGAAPLPDRVEGFASCVNALCERFNEDRPLAFKIERVTQTYKDLGGDLGFVDRETEHFSPEDDADIICPDCGHPCSLIPGKRRVIPNHTRNLGLVR